jgi:hypothetical protein
VLCTRSTGVTENIAVENTSGDHLLARLFVQFSLMAFQDKTAFCCNAFIPLSIRLGVVGFKKWFRFYSIVTIVMLLLPAILAFLYVPQIGANQPTPWLGLAERIS